MTRIPLFQIDAFAETLFKGNPGAVCPLESWISDEDMQLIAAENNLSETAFYVPEAEGFSIRWFTPKCEINLCGHGTVATAHVLWQHLGYQHDVIKLYSKSGELQVSKDQDKIVLNFPSIGITPASITAEFITVFGNKIEEAYVANNGALLIILPNENEVLNFTLNKDLLLQLPYPIVYITATGVESDFVSRVFAPAMQIDEDPVTGSAHCVMVPYWAARFGKKTLFAKQCSSRGGLLWCKDLGDRVEMAGHAVTYSVGEIWWR